MQTKFSKTVMVFGCVSCEVDVMPQHFFRQGLRSNSDAYVELLITVVEPWITTRVANGMPYVWQQDSAPSHNTSPNVWPPNSPDHNPMDYYVWGTVEKDANRRTSTTKVQLINIIKTFLRTFLGRVQI